MRPPFGLELAADIAQSSGLVRAYMDRHQALRLASRLDVAMVMPVGRLGIFGNDYLGCCEVSGFSISRALEIAESLNETLMFFPLGETGAVVADCYRAGLGKDFSVVVQGDALVARLRPCVEAFV